jgi:type IV pilus assembly protein PilZ
VCYKPSKGVGSEQGLGDERRVGRRAAIELAVEYKRVNTFFSDYTKNISRGGTFIRTEKPLAIGTEFVFALSVPLLADPLRLRGRVKWVVHTDAATEQSPPGMGIEFVYRDDAERAETEDVVEGLMNRELGDTLAAKLLGRK